MFTDSYSFEGHIHIDIKTDDILVRSFLESFCQNKGLALVDHNLDLKLDGNLAQIAAEAPIQHYDIKPNLNKCFQTNFNNINVLAKKAFVYLGQELGQLNDYVEGEWLLFKDYSNKTKPAFLETNLFDCIISNNLVTIDTGKQYFEFHWTLPADFVSKNIEIFQKSGLQSVGFEKNCEKYLVLTTLVPTWKDGLILAKKVDNLQYGDWKLEVKKYYSQDMSQWKFLMTTIKH